MSRFAINTPYLVLVVCAIVAILGVAAVVQMPVDMFPSMNIPVVVVATFYAGMPPEQIEGDITYHLERFFTLASGIDPHRIALVKRRQHHPRLFPIEHERRYRCGDHCQPGCLRHERPAPRHTSSGCA